MAGEMQNDKEYQHYQKAQSLAGYPLMSKKSCFGSTGSTSDTVLDACEDDASCEDDADDGWDAAAAWDASPCSARLTSAYQHLSHSMLLITHPVEGSGERAGAPVSQLRCTLGQVMSTCAVLKNSVRTGSVPFMPFINSSRRMRTLLFSSFSISHNAWLPGGIRLFTDL